MIFVDTNVFMYAVGRPHPLQAEARRFFIESLDSPVRLATSVEVLQELLHAYLPVGRLGTFDAASELAHARMQVVFEVEGADLRLARTLADREPGLGARDLIHLACCQRRDVREIKTFDRALSAAFAKGG